MESGFFELVLFALAAAIAGCIRGFTGFGGPAVLTLFLVPFYSPLSVVSKVVVVDLISNIKLIPDVYRQPGWRPVWPWFVLAAAAVPIGHLAVLQMDADALRQGLGILVVLCTAAMLAGWRCNTMPHASVSWPLSAAAGVVMGGVFIALPMMAYVSSLPQSSAHSRAQAIVWAFFTGVALLITQSFTGVFGISDLAPVAVMAVAYLGGSIAGAKGFRRASEVAVRRAVLFLLLFLALMTIVV